MLNSENQAPPDFEKFDEDTQLRLWVGGTSTHRKNHKAGNNTFLCVPDFSCCRHELGAPLAQRLRYYEGNAATRAELKRIFMTKAIASRFPGAKIVQLRTFARGKE